MLATLPVATNLAYNCPPGCSLHPQKTGNRIGNIILEMRANGAGRMPIKARLEGLLERKVAESVVARHLTHIREVNPEPQKAPRGAKANDLDILEAIIQSGFQNSQNWKPGIRDTLDAIKLKASLTGQSAFEDMLKAMDEAMGLPDEEIEDPEAVLAPEERSDDESASS